MRRLLILLSAIGALISIGLGMTQTFGINACGSVGCSQVLASPYAHLLGVPNTVLGVGYFLLVLGFAIGMTWGELEWDAMLGLSGVVAVVAVALVALQFWMGAFCPYCLVCNGIAVVIFGLLWRWSRRERGVAEKRVLAFLILTALAFGVPLAGHLISKGLLSPPPARFIAPGAEPSVVWDGPEDAALTIRVYLDYECEFCRQAYLLMKSVRALHPDSVRWGMVMFPLRSKPNSVALAIEAKCAERQGKFWAVSDKMFSHLDAGDRERFWASIGLDLDQMRGCIEDPSVRGGIASDKAKATQQGIQMTPTFVVKGRILEGMPDPSAFQKWVQDQLKKQEK